MATTRTLGSGSYRTASPGAQPLLHDGATGGVLSRSPSNDPNSAAQMDRQVDCAPPNENDDVQAHLYPLPYGSGQKIMAAMFGFFLQGLFSSGIGAIIPKLEDTYGLTDATVSFIFICSPLGYFVAANLNSVIHVRCGQRGIATIGPICQIVFASIAATEPPFPIFLAAAVIGGFGSGLIEAAWCAWSAGMGKDANRIQGYMHGAFSMGCSLGPMIVGSLISSGKPWRNWYALLSIFTLLELLTSMFAFRHENAAAYHRGLSKLDDDTSGMVSPSDVKSLFRYPISWICGAFLLAYVGIETSITGWIVVYMSRSRHIPLVFAGLFSSLFNIGMGVGRLALGVLTDRLGVRRALDLYLLLAFLFQAAFTIVRLPPLNAALMAMLGVVLGPMFPSCITMLVLHLPRSIHVHGVASVALLGQLGGAVMPFAQGFLAGKVGIKTYPYIILVQLATLMAICRCFPKRL
ncbi:MFS general substrate transporter [Ophiobolus disseminans]|uniref:MFS general substrate transporter n=1 Tax=Ophiobolus disseminans TaxID=1469910 RepID=A0A6A7A0H2_9PLEO|nr:MFS general substrate transporter [Ophiobolus disseminans]